MCVVSMVKFNALLPHLLFPPEMTPKSGKMIRRNEIFLEPLKQRLILKSLKNLINWGEKMEKLWIYVAQKGLR